MIKRRRGKSIGKQQQRRAADRAAGSAWAQARAVLVRRELLERIAAGTR